VPAVQFIGKPYATGVLHCVAHGPQTVAVLQAKDAQWCAASDYLSRPDSIHPVINVALMILSSKSVRDLKSKRFKILECFELTFPIIRVEELHLVMDRRLAPPPELGVHSQS
jgi:hypothetical protein